MADPARRAVRLLALVLAALALGASAALAQIESPPGQGYHDCIGCGAETVDPNNRPVRVRVAAGGQYEFLSVGPARSEGAMRAIIEQEGGRVLRVAALGGLGQVGVVSVFPGGGARERAQARIGAEVSGAALAPNHVFSYAQAQAGAGQAGAGSGSGSGRAPRLYAASLIGAAPLGGCQLSRALSIGMIDGPVNPAHPALAGVDLRLEALAEGRAADASHGTGVAALMVGRDPEGRLSGFAQGARLYAVSVFARRERGDETSAELVVLALDRLVGAGVRLINMSIAGPENPALARALAAAGARGVVMIAASGNQRRSVVDWPAAAPEVIAVTAVDAARRRYAMANTGAAVELAAPGVDVYAARARGAGYVSGTSFAAPIVTALAAREMAAGLRGADAVRARLRARAEPLGGAARSREFGFGLARAGGC